MPSTSFIFQELEDVMYIFTSIKSPSGTYTYKFRRKQILDLMIQFENDSYCKEWVFCQSHDDFEIKDFFYVRSQLKAITDRIVCGHELFFPWKPSSNEEHEEWSQFQYMIPDQMIGKSDGKFVDRINLFRRKLSIPREPEPVKLIKKYANDFGLEWQRPSLENVFIEMSNSLMKRSTCMRKQVGALFTNRDYTRVLCLGYNGGFVNDVNGCESLSPGKCGCIHAEVNAMIKTQESLAGSHLFVTTAPCVACSKLLINAGVEKVYYITKYRDSLGLALLEKNRVKLCEWGSVE